MKRVLFLFLFFCCGSFVYAQSTRITSTRNLFWGAASFNVKLTDRWMLVSDGLYRFEYTDGDAFQAGIRAGGRYTTTKGWQYTAGGVFFLHYPNPNGIVPRGELRYEILAETKQFHAIRLTLQFTCERRTQNDNTQK